MLEDGGEGDPVYRADQDAVQVCRPGGEELLRKPTQVGHIRLQGGGTGLDGPAFSHFVRPRWLSPAIAGDRPTYVQQPPYRNLARLTD